ncbi:globin domain-containing protein [Streptomyces bullii]|uniref:nitric oxide dioxygenase n=1 Tax=Streptomyces bullii TaxID=349910 RepID=A0ABW0UK07_9ACTN
MFEARHTMDAPTTTSADNGTSDGGGGWFTPRKQPTPTSGGESSTSEGRRLATIRPVGRPAAHQDSPTDGTARRSPSTEGDRAAATSEAGRPAATVDRPSSTTGGVSPAPAAAVGAARPRPGADNASPDRVSPDTEARGAGDDEPTPDRGALAAIAAPASAVARQAAPAAPSGLAPAAPPPAPSTNAHAPASEIPVGSPFASPSVPPAGPRVPFQRPAPPLAPASTPAEAGASPDAVLIRRAMAEITPVADKVTSYFYALLFVRHPDLRSLFPAAMDTQRDRLLKALLTAAEHIDNQEVLVEYLENLGRGHRKYGTRAEHYPAVGECLIGALSKYASHLWDADMEAAWVRTYTTISQIMIDAAAADELRAPAWWHAEVVTHDLRTPDIAVITVRPDQPYPFLAGQYTSLETPWWPRIWRHYSFASAPRSDGLLSFHVKAVPAGWVSNALVHRARPGDVLRLGPPAGSMTVDHTTDSGLLCLGGGTGIAPIKALVEDVAEHGQRRPVEVFYGARTDQDLYDIDTMLRLQQSHPWLSVRAIIDEQAHQQLPDAVRAYGPWNEYDAYLSGPPGMIRNGVHALRNAGIPAARIRHDSVEELVAAGD